MIARPQSQLAMRPLLPADVPLLAEIFRASIEELTAEDYSEAQQEAWAETADDLDAFGAKLAAALTLVATFAGSPVGFASLADNTRIDMLYVHPAAAGQGAGSMLCDALEKLAAARGAKEVDGRGERYGERLFREARLYRQEPQHRVARRRMARQYHDDQTARSEGKCAMKRPDTPFPRHWLYYLILKYAVIAAAVAMSFYTVYRLYRG